MSEQIREARHNINGIILTGARIGLERFSRGKSISPRDMECLHSLADVIDITREAALYVETNGQEGSIPAAHERGLWRETERVLKITSSYEQDSDEVLAFLSDSLRAPVSLEEGSLETTLGFVKSYEEHYLSESGSNGCSVDE